MFNYLRKRSPFTEIFFIQFVCNKKLLQTNMIVIFVIFL